MPKRERLFTKSTGGIKAQMKEEEGEVKKEDGGKSHPNAKWKRRNWVDYARWDKKTHTEFLGHESK